MRGTNIVEILCAWEENGFGSVREVIETELGIDLTNFTDEEVHEIANDLGGNEICQPDFGLVEDQLTG